MTTTVHARPATKARMTNTRRSSLAAGICYLLTFISIPTLFLYNKAKTDPDFILGSNDGMPVMWGGVLELIVGLAGIGTAVALYPVVKRQNESLALGFVAARTLEAALIFVGVASIVSLVALQQDFGTAPGADTSALVLVGASHASSYQWAFTVSQSLMPGINALLLGTLMYRSRLVPRILPLMGLIGAPLLITSTFATVAGLNEPLSAWSALSALPVAAWELSLGIYLLTKGFKPTPLIEALDAEEAMHTSTI
ncbi:MAG: DUF4386 domain-containing protein [Candidatus Nanopelagicales bacterium]|nr:DUF4386 domain-containing protein [Candidatus Nanopelagicales bacterium]